MPIHLKMPALIYTPTRLLYLKHKIKPKFPRFKRLEIPKGSYCYTPKGWYKDRLTITSCPYWYYIKGEEEQLCGGCRLLNKTDKDFIFGLLWDSVKMCEFNDWRDYDEI